MPFKPFLSALQSVMGKVYGRIMIEGVRRITDEIIGEHKNIVFRTGWGCVDQMLVVHCVLRQMVKKAHESGHKVYTALIYL